MTDTTALAKAAAAGIIVLVESSQRGVPVFATRALMPHMAMLLDRRGRMVPPKTIEKRPQAVRTVYCGADVWMWLQLATQSGGAA